MTPEIFIKRQMNARSVSKLEVVQGLWSGCGEIVRYSISGVDSVTSVILKQIQVPTEISHPRGWSSNHAAERKIHSYLVEQNWYEAWSSQCDDECRVARCFGIFSHAEKNQTYILLEDLNDSGFHVRRNELTVFETVPCLQWLASFHARFMTRSPNKSWPKGLWEKGTYWHLDTRQDEWNAMSEGRLKSSARRLSEALENSTFQTLVHGDAKVANFCFSHNMDQVSAVDFQYVGKGIGVQDVAYFLGSCLSENELELHLDYLLDNYFSELSRCLVAQGESPDLSEEVAKEWHSLFSIAWADFHRFIAGWSPNHKKNTSFSQKVTTIGLDRL